MIKGLLIVTVAPGNDQNERVARDLKRPQHLFNWPHQKLRGFGKPLLVRVLGAVVDDPNIEIGLGREVAHGLSNVPRADDHQPDSGENRQPSDALLGLGPGTLGQRGGSLAHLQRGHAGGQRGDQVAVGTKEEPAAERRAFDSVGIDDDRLGEALAGLQGFEQPPVVFESLGALERFNRDHHFAAANQAVGPGVIVVEDERVEPDSVLAKLPDGVLFDFVLDAAAAQRPNLPAARVDDHHRARLLRGRAARLDHLAKERLATLLQGLDQMSNNIAHGLVFPIGNEMGVDHPGIQAIALPPAKQSAFHGDGQTGSSSQWNNEGFDATDNYEYEGGWIWTLDEDGGTTYESHLSNHMWGEHTTGGEWGDVWNITYTYEGESSGSGSGGSYHVSSGGWSGSGSYTTPYDETTSWDEGYLSPSLSGVEWWRPNAGRGWGWTGAWGNESYTEPGPGSDWPDWPDEPGSGGPGDPVPTDPPPDPAPRPESPPWGDDAGVFWTTAFDEGSVVVAPAEPDGDSSIFDRLARPGGEGSKGAF